MLQTDVEVFGLVRLHAAQGHPRLPDELIMCQLVFVTHGHPGIERENRGGEVKIEKLVREKGENMNKICWFRRRWILDGKIFNVAVAVAVTVAVAMAVVVGEV